MNKKSRLPVFVIAVCTFVLAGATTYVVVNRPGESEIQQAKQEQEPKKPQDAVQTLPKPEKNQRKVVDLTPRYDADDNLILDRKEGSAAEGTDGMAEVINRYLEKIPAVPKDARCESVELEGALALVDFSSSFDRGYGTDDEQTIIKGVLTALGQFPEVKFAKFLVGGKPLSTLGSIDLKEALEVERGQSDSASDSTIGG